MNPLSAPPKSLPRPLGTLTTLACGPLTNRYGLFDYYVFTDGCQQALVLTTPGLLKNPPRDAQATVICRIHSSCVSAHVFFSQGCDCVQQMHDTLYEITRDQTQVPEEHSQSREKVPGIVILLDQEAKGNGIAAYVKSLELRKSD